MQVTHTHFTRTKKYIKIYILGNIVFVEYYGTGQRSARLCLLSVRTGLLVLLLLMALKYNKKISKYYIYISYNNI